MSLKKCFCSYQRLDLIRDDISRVLTQDKEIQEHSAKLALDLDVFKQAYMIAKAEKETLERRFQESERQLQDAMTQLKVRFK